MEGKDIKFFFATVFPINDGCPVELVISTVEEGPRGA